MTVKVNKFGTILNGRPAGREAGLVLNQMITGELHDESIILDFEGVMVLTPSYADEFLRILKEDPSHQWKAVNTTSPVILDSLKAIGLG